MCTTECNSMNASESVRHYPHVSTQTRYDKENPRKVELLKGGRGNYECGKEAFVLGLLIQNRYEHEDSGFWRSDDMFHRIIS